MDICKLFWARLTLHTGWSRWLGPGTRVANIYCLSLMTVPCAFGRCLKKSEYLIARLSLNLRCSSLYAVEAHSPFAQCGLRLSPRTIKKMIG
jgi:hypothetical protein